MLLIPFYGCETETLLADTKRKIETFEKVMEEAALDLAMGAETMTGRSTVATLVGHQKTYKFLVSRPSKPRTGNPLIRRVNWAQSIKPPKLSPKPIVANMSGLAWGQN